MLPVQILANNLLYDIGQTTIPTDAVDRERVVRPRRWDLAELTRFVHFIGPCSSVFDYTTYLMMLYVFNCWYQRLQGSRKGGSRSNRLYSLTTPLRTLARDRSRQITARLLALDECLAQRFDLVVGVLLVKLSQQLLL